MGELAEKNAHALEFRDFLLMYARHCASPRDHADELLQAFRVLDASGGGTIDLEGLLHRLTHEGEAFSDKQAQEFHDIVRRHFKDDKNVSYKLLTKILVNSYSRY